MKNYKKKFTSNNQKDLKNQIKELMCHLNKSHYVMKWDPKQ